MWENIYIYIIVKFVKFYLTFEMFVWLRGNNWRKNSFGRDIKKIESKFHEFPFTDIEKQSGSAIVRVEGRMKIDRRSLEGTSFPCQGESDIRDDLMSIGGGKTSLSPITGYISSRHSLHVTALFIRLVSTNRLPRYLHRGYYSRAGRVTITIPQSSVKSWNSTGPCHAARCHLERWQSWFVV